MSDDERKVRERAREIWEEEGRPEGRAGQHWRRASEEVHQAPPGSGGLSNADVSPMASVGSASGLQPGGTIPGGSPAAGMGSLGTGGGSTAGAATGSAKRAKDRRRGLPKD